MKYKTVDVWHTDIVSREGNYNAWVLKGKVVIIIIMDSYSAHVCHSVTLLTLTIITPALAQLPLQRSSITRNNFLPGTHLLHLGRETILDKMPCLRAYALSGNRTHDPLIMSREHDPIHYSAPTLVTAKLISIYKVLSISMCFWKRFPWYKQKNHINTKYTIHTGL